MEKHLLNLKVCGSVDGFQVFDGRLDRILLATASSLAALVLNPLRLGFAPKGRFIDDCSLHRMSKT